MLCAHVLELPKSWQCSRFRWLGGSFDWVGMLASVRYLFRCVQYGQQASVCLQEGPHTLNGGQVTTRRNKQLGCSGSIRPALASQGLKGRKPSTAAGASSLIVQHSCWCCGQPVLWRHTGTQEPRLLMTNTDCRRYCQVNARTFPTQALTGRRRLQLQPAAVLTWQSLGCWCCG